jgi:hypothetical protein
MFVMDDLARDIRAPAPGRDGGGRQGGANSVGVFPRRGTSCPLGNLASPGKNPELLSVFSKPLQAVYEGIRGI